MKTYNKTLIFAIALLFVTTSCSRKKETGTIITKIEAPKVSHQVQVIGDKETTKDFQWNGEACNAVITVKADKEASVVKDGDGNKYYDNKVTLTVNGNGGQLFHREFTKGDFKEYINTDYLKPSRSTLLSIVFNRVEGGNAMFVATVGSPDAMADEFMLVGISLSKSGGMTMSRIQETE